MNVTDKPAVFITGAAAGIGHAIAKQFADNGWFVGVYDIDVDAAQRAFQDIGSENGCTGFIDVRDPVSIQSALDDFARHTGNRLHILVNNAGVLRVGPFEEIPIDDHHWQIDVNAHGPASCCHLAFPLLRDTPGARVINMASASANFGVPEFATYSATKFFVRGFTEALNIEWKRHDIHVCDIWPPFVKSAMTEGIESKIVDRMGISLVPEHVANVVWKAAHGTKVHWTVGAQFKALKFVMDRAPFTLRKTIMRLIAGYP